MVSLLIKSTLLIVILTIIIYISEYIYVHKTQEPDPRVVSLFGTLKIIGIIVSIILVGTTMIRRTRRLDMTDYTRFR